MSPASIIELLKDACEALQPFTSEVKQVTKTWDGNSYSLARPEQFHEVDPYALAWWATFTTSIALLEHENKLSTEQLGFLKSTLCGGMGSFQDFALDSDVYGYRANDANSKLEEIRASMFKVLDEMVQIDT